jgi:hypothetical protein
LQEDDPLNIPINSDNFDLGISNDQSLKTQMNINLKDIIDAEGRIVSTPEVYGSLDISGYQMTTDEDDRPIFTRAQNLSLLPFHSHNAVSKNLNLHPIDTDPTLLSPTARQA